jgi:hypothetical protein
MASTHGYSGTHTLDELSQASHPSTPTGPNGPAVMHGSDAMPVVKAPLAFKDVSNTPSETSGRKV